MPDAPNGSPRRPRRKSPRSGPDEVPEEIPEEYPEESVTLEVLPTDDASPDETPEVCGTVPKPSNGRV